MPTPCTQLSSTLLIHKQHHGYWKLHSNLDVISRRSETHITKWHIFFYMSYVIHRFNFVSSKFWIWTAARVVMFRNVPRVPLNRRESISRKERLLGMPFSTSWGKSEAATAQWPFWTWLGWPGKGGVQWRIKKSYRLFKWQRKHQNGDGRGGCSVVLVGGRSEKERRWNDRSFGVDFWKILYTNTYSNSTNKYIKNFEYQARWFYFY